MFSAEGADGLVESASKVEGGEADAGQGVSGVAGWIASNSDASSDMTSSEAAIAAACRVVKNLSRMGSSMANRVSKEQTIENLADCA